MPRKKTIEETYQKKSPREHVLLRPDTYVGSVERDKEKMFVLDEKKMMMEEQEVEYVPALYKIFDEILVNAADNKQRDTSMKEIRVKIDILNGFISIKNDGKGIPIEIHKEHNMYIPELIFGNLLTSSNYNDADLKTVGGRNGYGAKLANIFSKKFIVETVDSEQSKKYKQTWTNNMSKKGEPDIISLSSTRRNNDYTKVTFYPDFKRFNMTSFENEDIIKLFIKRIFDVAGTTTKDLNVYLNIVEPPNDNDEESKYAMFDGRSALKIRTFIDYTKLFIGQNVKNKTDYFYFKDDKSNNWEIIFAISNDNEYRQISHVNNIWTIKGGTHVKYIESQFIKYFKDNFKDKQKKIKEMLKPKMIRDHLFVFVNSKIVNPAFSSQTKEILTTKSSQFGSKCPIPEDIMKRLMNKIKGIVKEFLNFKLDQAAKKTDGKRKRKLNLPPEIDDANDAGSKHSSDCTLIVTEGLSAKTLAVAGITELPGSKNRFGIFPLKGKLLNVRDASRSQINKNNEINNLKQVLGLKHGIKYDNKKAISSLRYGKIMIMTDQDYDGSHIKGLMINLFHSEWPELIQNKLFGKNGNESFIDQFITPIVVAKKGKKQRKLFYTVPQYEQWKKENNNGKGWKIKYYKGLGTWQRKDGKEHFRNLATHRIAFKYGSTNNNFNNNTNTENPNDLAIVKAFDKKKADLRKEWISSFEPENTFLDFTKLGINGRNKKVSYHEFIDKELILFSVNDLHRSVPSIYDGLKPGQRKILYCCFLKNNLKTEIRVAQLGGYVSEKSAYHHGETSLYQTIIGMAQDYVGSNNINLLAPNGMFGSRIRGGKDAASPRYIHTNLAKITRKLYINHDDMIVKYQQDDGYPVEPIYYIPIIPMVLINGALGIGTGWSTFIPNYNPQDIIRNIRRKLSGEQWEMIHPFYRGFKGEIILQPNTNTDDNNNNTYSYKIHGKAEIINTFTDNNTNLQYSTIQITELPIQCWTENYKKFLMDLEETEQIENVNNMSSDIDVAFTFDIQHKQRPTKGSKGRGRKKTNDDQRSLSGTNSVSTSPQRNGGNNNSNNSTKKFKKKVYFNGNLDEQFLKDMKLISSMGLTNMVLFDTNGRIKRYANVCEILEEFYIGRLSHYSTRKKALLNAMEHQLKKISNQARFIMMIIDDKLVISKRKKFDVIRDLKDHKFDIWLPSKDDSNTLRNRAKATDAFQDDGTGDNDDENKDNNDKMDIDKYNDDKQELKRLSEGYKYLLSMSISSLTKERVDELLQKQEETTSRVNALKLKSAKDLWRDDLDELDIHLKQYDETYEETIEQMRKEAEQKRLKNNKNNKTNTKTKGRGRGKRKNTKTSTAKSKSTTIKKQTKITTKVTKNTSSKKKKKLLSDNQYPSDPFSIAKRNGQKSKPKSTSNTKNNSYDYDYDSDQSSSPEQQSLFQRANLKRNSPQKTRKRKRKLLDSDESESDNDNDLEIMEPPRKKRNTLSLSSSISSNSSKTSKTSSSKLPLKPKSINKQKSKSISNGMDDDDDEYDFNDDYDEESEDEDITKQRRSSPRRTNRNKSSKPKYIDDSSEESELDEDENTNLNTKRVLKKKITKRVDSDSEYNFESEDNLELDEDDDDDDNYSDDEY